MYKNYFILRRFAAELNERLSGCRVMEIFSQEKDTAVLHLDKEDLHLEVCVNPGFPFLNLRKSFNRAKKNTVEIFAEYLPAEIKSIETCENDRIIRINFQHFALYFAVRGKYTNLTLIDDRGGAQAFKKTDDNEIPIFVKETGTLIFSENYKNTLPSEDLKSCTQFEDIRKKFPFIGKEIVLESKYRDKAGSTLEDKIKILEQIIFEIGRETPAVFTDKNEFEARLAVDTFHIFPRDKKELFDDMTAAFEFFIGRHFFFLAAAEKSKKISKKLDRELKNISNKLNSVKATIENGSSEEKYAKLGNILLINLGSMRKGMPKISVEDPYEEGKIIDVPLDEKMSPRQNADKYFNKAKSERIGLEKSKHLFKGLSKEYEKLKDIETKFKSASSMKDFNFIMKELNMKEDANRSEQDELRDKFKHYLIDGKYNVYVGKDSANNDLLTTRFAKQNDYWFHARSVSGSHVVLRNDNKKEQVPKNILKKAAALAAYHSKAKTAGMAPVSYALKKYVVKKKGMEPGKVALLKEDVLIVKPEIPLGCEYF